MKFNYRHAKLPGSNRLLGDVDAAALRLHEKLAKLNVKSLTISDYNKRYLGNILERLRGYLQLYSYLLSWSISPISLPLEEIVFIDYGGGSGMMTYLAKELGIGTVVYTDIYEVSCHDSKFIGDTIGNSADYYVHGDLDSLIDFLKSNSLSCHAVSSYDVIEHIYDIDNFFDRIHLLSNSTLVIMMSTSANPMNPRIRKRIMRQHLEFEFHDREYKYGRKPTDATEALFSLREKIIRQYDSSLADNEVKHLGNTTRGLILSDIHKSIDYYKSTGKYPEVLKHPTNTCDPYTGNWFENFIDLNHIQSILEKNGVSVELLAGYYGNQNNIIKSLAAELINICIANSGLLGFRFAPFYSVYGIIRK